MYYFFQCFYYGRPDGKINIYYENFDDFCFLYIIILIAQKGLVGR